PNPATCVHVCDSDTVWPKKATPPPVMVPAYCREILPDKPAVVATISARTTSVKLKVRPPAVMVNASGPRRVLSVPVLKVAAPPAAIPASAQAPGSKGPSTQEDTVPAGLIVLDAVSAVILPVSSVTLPIRLIPNDNAVAEALPIAPANTIAANSLVRDFIGSPRVIVCTFCTPQVEQETCLGSSSFFKKRLNINAGRDERLVCKSSRHRPWHNACAHQGRRFRRDSPDQLVRGGPHGKIFDAES